MNILQFFPSAKKKSSSEYFAACPACGGSDRLAIWPDKNKCWCRQCSQSWDTIQLLRDFHSMTYQEACEATGRPLDDRSLVKHTNISKIDTKPVTSTQWLKRAQELLAWSQRHFQSMASGCHGNPEGLAFLMRRWINPQTALACGLGWIPKDMHDKPKNWGFESSSKKIFIPKGLLIYNKYSVEIRRADYKQGDSLPKYIQIRGGKKQPFILLGKPAIWVIGESAIDACLFWQEARDLATFIGLQGCSNTIRIPESVKLIVSNFDADEADEAAWQKFRAQYPRAIRLPPIKNCKNLADLNPIEISPFIKMAIGFAKTKNMIAA